MKTSIRVSLMQQKMLKYKFEDTKGGNSKGRQYNYIKTNNGLLKH